MIYIYRQRASSGARELAEALGGRRIRNLARVTFHPGDVVVCWGENVDAHNGQAFFVNNGPIRSKFTDAITLKAAGVSTIEVSESIPQHQGTPVYSTADWDWALTHEQVAALMVELEAWMRANPPINGITWLPRTNSHTGGNDLLNPPLSGQINYYSRRESLSHEYRVHSFNGQSIRAGKKVPRPGVDLPHDWIRSWDGGWRISYDGVSVRNTHRELAHQAISALGLTFGAVDIGERQDGSLLVLEVNRAPGLEGGTVTAYAAAIQRLMEGVGNGSERA